MVENSTMDTLSYEAQVQLLKVLTHPVRLAILDVLREDEHCVCHMEAHLGLRQAYISQQLMVLREAGIIQDRRDGWNVYYRVVEPRVFEVLKAVEKMLGQKRKALAEQPVAACSCPKCSLEARSNPS